MMKNENILSYFKLICVDNQLNNLPDFIKVVPTMIVTNMNKPLVAQEIFKYIQSIKYIRQKSVLDQNKKLVQQNIINMVEQNKKGPLGYKASEMSSISDNFAYTDVDVALPQNFVNINDKHIIYTPPKDESINKITQTKLVESLDQARKEQDKEYTNIFKQQRLEAIGRAQGYDV
jgi:hypothetical protein